MITISPTSGTNLPANPKPKQKVAFIIGNGFNFLIQDIIIKYDTMWLPPHLKVSKEQIAESLGEITTLWKRFDDLLSSLKGQYDKVSDEELIRMIYTVIDFFSSIEAFEKVLDKKAILNLRQTFDFLLIEKIREIAEEFYNHEKAQGGYKDLKALFPEFGDDFNNLLNKHDISDCDFFTTNYDGVLDTLLTKANRGFNSTDGFSVHPGFENYLRIQSDSLRSSPIRCIHIHGSYKFEKKYGDTYKAKSGGKSPTEKLEPVIIFNNPDLKGELIRRDPVLNLYFSFMYDSLEKADKLIILETLWKQRNT